MRRLPQTFVLVGASIALVVLVLAAVVPATLETLEELTRSSAEARLELAAAGALEALAHEQHLAMNAAQVLAERPTLARLLSDEDDPALTAFLERYRAASGLAFAAVVDSSALRSLAPVDLPWRAELLGEGFTTAPDLGVVVCASTPVAQLEGVVVVVARPLDGERLGSIAQQVGATVEILATPRSGSLVATRDLGNGLAVVVELDRTSLEAPLSTARRRVVLATVLGGVLAILIGGWAGHRIAAPLRGLSRAADRIGGGDLRTPVEATLVSIGSAETQALAARMEAMRRHLNSLTSDLERREAEAQAILGGIVEGVFAVDADRNIEYLNPQAAAILGIHAEESLGRFCGDVLWPRGRAHRPCEDRCPIVFARSRGSSRAVETLELASGRRTVVITSAPPRSGRQMQVLRDETEIEAARRSRDIVLANVSHELKTPLAAQLASLELLRDGIDELPAQAKRDLVAALERSTRRLALLIDNLLESVRIETGQAAVRRVPVDLGSVVDEAAVSMGPLLAQRGQPLRLGIQDNLPTVLGDATELGQVLVNLLANAHKYAPEGSAIEVDVAARGDQVVVTVDDAGSGVASSASSSIFDRYRRGAADARGLGLGLWIAKSIVVRHGGTIEADTSPTGGARFIVSIPAGGGS